MKKKTTMIMTLAIIIALVASYFIVPGFSKQGSAFITDFSVSEDGTEMTINIGVATSVGYVRKVSEHQQHGGKLYLDCYSAFGGINGSWGAKNEYTIKLNEDTEMIAIYRSVNCYDTVLEKGEDDTWQYADGTFLYDETQEKLSETISADGATGSTSDASDPSLPLVQAAEPEAWKITFEKSLFENYGAKPHHYEDLGDGVYQVYVEIDGKIVPYVAVDSKTGNYHG